MLCEDTYIANQLANTRAIASKKASKSQPSILIFGLNIVFSCLARPYGIK